MNGNHRDSTAQERAQLAQSAAILLSRGQICLGLFITTAIVIIGQRFGWHAVLQGTVEATTVFFVLSVGLKFALRAASGRYQFPKLSLPDPADKNLPTVSILIALRGEEESVGRLVRALTRLLYPTTRLEVLLLVEEFDTTTQAAFQAIQDVPAHITMMLVPSAGPTNKPKALNWGWMHATGQIVTVYDAEDRMDTLQLLKVAARFAQLAITKPEVACLQAQLIFWNPRLKLVSTMYFAEYLVHFTWVLRGLAKLGFVPPLGGTSNSFLNYALRDVARTKGTRTYYKTDGSSVAIEGPWDEHNVTEDATLAMDLAYAGYKTDMLDSFTYEEAPVSFSKSINQRCRWLKGYLQTFLVHGRRPLQHIRRVGLLPWASFELLMISAPLALILLPITWGVTIVYVIARWVDPLPEVTRFILGLYPTPIFYIAITLAVLGNCVLFFQKLSAVTAYQEKTEISTQDVGTHGAELKEQMYGLVPRLLLTFAWWAFTSISAYKAVGELLHPAKRSIWHLSKHGHHGTIEDRLESITVPTGIPRPSEVEP